ncbi:hypothetical protein cand_007650 [Cryptosporidium andersoni]|uniref:Eukaryotic translation initiation factor 3 subunit L n=1 Tax=Cryptosporidium andersoni TaxID=117008 RepID=A0A1J4MRF0_9CRYT|nr:hypothetical protein cand_007650 [Cryptosporidium andersoni]
MSFRIVPDPLEDVEDDVVNTAVAVAVVSNRNVLMEIEANEDEESDLQISYSTTEELSTIPISNIPEAAIPDDVQSFLLNLSDALNENDIEKIRHLYEISFHSLTYRYYMKSHWPSISSVESILETMGSYSEVSILLYSELYYRHVFAKFPNQVKWQDRVASWKNYVKLFGFLLLREFSKSNSQPIKITNSLAATFEQYGVQLQDNSLPSDKILLPSEWIYGIMDEFVYQLQDTCRYTVRVTHASNDYSQDDRVNKIDQNIWRCDITLQLFQTIIDESKIRSILSGSEETQVETALISQAQDTIPLRYQLGYFSMLCLVRIHVLLGDYYTAIEVADFIDSQLLRTLLWKVPTAYVSYLYYLGFAYMMLQRYIDAIRIFQQSTVSFASSTVGSSSLPGNQGTSSYQHDAIGKCVDRMSWLMLFCQLLSYGSNSSNINRLEETLSHQGDRKLASTFVSISSDISNWKELLLKVSPRFISSCIPQFLHEEDSNKIDFNESQNRQMTVFTPSVQIYELSCMIRSFTKLYNNLNVETLASLMHVAKKGVNQKSRSVIKECDEKLDSKTNTINVMEANAINDDLKPHNPADIARSQIMAIKSRSGRQIIWKPGTSLLGGEIVSISGDFDLLLDVDTIHIMEGKQVDKFFGDVFAKQIIKAQNLLRHISSLSTVKSSGDFCKKDK